MVLINLANVLENNLQPLFMDGVQLCQGYRATSRRQFTFYHSVILHLCTSVCERTSSSEKKLAERYLSSCCPQTQRIAKVFILQNTEPSPPTEQVYHSNNVPANQQGVTTRMIRPSTVQHDNTNSTLADSMHELRLTDIVRLIFQTFLQKGVSSASFDIRCSQSCHNSLKGIYIVHSYPIKKQQPVRIIYLMISFRPFIFLC